MYIFRDKISNKKKLIFYNSQNLFGRHKEKSSPCFLEKCLLIIPKMKLEIWNVFGAVIKRMIFSLCVFLTLGFVFYQTLYPLSIFRAKEKVFSYIFPSSIMLNFGLSQELIPMNKDVHIDSSKNS